MGMITLNNDFVGSFGLKKLPGTVIGTGIKEVHLINPSGMIVDDIFKVINFVIEDGPSDNQLSSSLSKSSTFNSLGERFPSESYSIPRTKSVISISLLNCSRSK